MIIRKITPLPPAANKDFPGRFTFPAIINLRPALVWKNSLWARKEFFVRDNYNVHDFWG